jgi:hypothetical protein
VRSTGKNKVKSTKSTLESGNHKCFQDTVSTVKSTVQSTVKSTAKSIVKSTAKSTVKSTAKSTVQSTVKSTVDSEYPSMHQNTVSTAVQ